MFPFVSVWLSVLSKASGFHIVFPQLLLSRFLGWRICETPSESVAGPFIISLHHVTEKNVEFAIQNLLVFFIVDVRVLLGIPLFLVRFRGFQLGLFKPCWKCRMVDTSAR